MASMSMSSQRYVSSSSSTRTRGVRESPFRETEWDRKLDNMLEDLEGATGSGGTGRSGLATSASSGFGMANTGANQMASSSSSYRSSSQQQQQQSSYSSSSRSNRQLTSTQDFGFANGHSSAPSGGGGADSILKDLEGSLRETSSYIESRRQAVPGGGQGSERSEYHSYTSDGGTGFNLERQVQHMMPGGSSSAAMSSSYAASRSQTGGVTSSMQQQKQSYSSYKVSQSGGYTSTDGDSGAGSRPGSRLKQNIDDLDTLLYDLNHAKKTSDQQDYTVSSVASTDYAYNEGKQGHVKKTATTYNEKSRYSDEELPPKRTVPPSNAHPALQPVTPSAFASKSSFESKQQSSYLYSSTAQDQDQPSGGAAYYAKYHSAQAHPSLRRDLSPPAARSPVPSTPPPSAGTQAPPKRVDQLMSELSEFDPSIRDTTFHEPDAPKKEMRKPFCEPTPERAEVARSVAGPAVYYPPGDPFSGTAKSKASSAPSTKPRKDKGTDGETKQGAAVVPICLPLCCAAPCVIM